jgi:predicted O-methyltransferase YrrM
MNKTILLTDKLYDYLLSVSLHEPPLMKRLRQETARLPYAGMQIAPEQGQFMAFLVRLMDVKKALELGVFTGYSALWVASALPEDGKLIACDVSEEWTSIARRYWTDAGVHTKIDLHLAPALDTLNSMLANGEIGTFDFAFIDADKENYINYYERVLQLLRPGGVIAVDNVLWSGKVADPNETDEASVALREFNRHLYADARIALSMLPIADGLTLALKRG